MEKVKNPKAQTTSRAIDETFSLPTDQGRAAWRWVRLAIPNYASTSHYSRPPAVAVRRRPVARLVIVLVAIVVSASHTTLQATPHTALHAAAYAALHLRECMSWHSHNRNYEGPLTQHGTGLDNKINEQCVFTVFMPIPHRKVLDQRSSAIEGLDPGQKAKGRNTRFGSKILIAASRVNCPNSILLQCRRKLF